MQAQLNADALQAGIGTHARSLDSTPICRLQWVLQDRAAAGFNITPASQPADNSAYNRAVSTPAIFLRN